MPWSKVLSSLLEIDSLVSLHLIRLENQFQKPPKLIQKIHPQDSVPLEPLLAPKSVLVRFSREIEPMYIQKNWLTLLQRLTSPKAAELMSWFEALRQENFSYLGCVSLLFQSGLQLIG